MIALVSWENDPVYIFYSSCKCHVKEQRGLRVAWHLSQCLSSGGERDPPCQQTCLRDSIVFWLRAVSLWGSPLHKGAHQRPRLGAVRQTGTPWCLLPFICLQGPQLPARAPEGWPGAATWSFAVLVPFLSLPPGHIPLELPCFFGALCFNLLRLKSSISPLQSLSLKPPPPATQLQPYSHVLLEVASFLCRPS